MRRIDDTPLDPEIAAQLDAIDATLAGEPVDPEHAELAELALLLTAGRPSIEPRFAASLDQRVARRFATAGEDPVTPAGGLPPLRRWWGSWLGPLAGLSTAVAAVVAAVVVLSSGGGGSSAGPERTATALSSGGSAAASSAGRALSLTAKPAARHGGTSTSEGSSAAAATGRGPLPASRTPQVVQSTNQPIFSPATGAVISAPRPVPNARKIIQSAELALSASNDHIEDVAQELFDAVGREDGYVNSSNVTAGSGGSAQFQLSVPSSALQATMSALSQLRYASVVSRTDATQDVNGEYLSDQRKLGDARALRTSLLKQLANATTQTQIDSLNARIRDAEASIRSDESTLRGLSHKIDYSQVSVTINSAVSPVSPRHHSGAFTLGKAMHDAGRVLTVVAGVALITMAVLLPVGLVVALGWWITVAARRRRREHALDLA